MHISKNDVIDQTNVLRSFGKNGLKVLVLIISGLMLNAVIPGTYAYLSDSGESKRNTFQAADISNFLTVTPGKAMAVSPDGKIDDLNEKSEHPAVQESSNQDDMNKERNKDNPGDKVNQGNDRDNVNSDKESNAIDNSAREGNSTLKNENSLNKPGEDALKNREESSAEKSILGLLVKSVMNSVLDKKASINNKLEFSDIQGKESTLQSNAEKENDNASNKLQDNSTNDINGDNSQSVEQPKSEPDKKDSINQESSNTNNQTENLAEELKEDSKNETVNDTTETTVEDSSTEQTVEKINNSPPIDPSEISQPVAQYNSKGELVLDFGIINESERHNFDTALYLNNITDNRITISWQFDGEIAQLFTHSMDQSLSSSKENNEKVVAKIASHPRYRVRKEWTDINSQLGAFRSFASAKSLAQQQGYKVFDEEGNELKTDPVEPKQQEEEVVSDNDVSAMHSKENFTKVVEAKQTYSLDMKFEGNAKPGIYEGFLVLNVNGNFLMKKIPARVVIV